MDKQEFVDALKLSPELREELKEGKRLAELYELDNKEASFTKIRLIAKWWAYNKQQEIESNELQDRT